MFQWAQKTFDQISQTVAPPPQDGPGRFAYSVQRKEEDVALGCIGEFDPVYTVVNPGKGWYPIHMACQYSLLRLIRQLLNYPGMNIEQVDTIGNTPLHHACTSSDLRALEVVQFLVNECGANVLAKNSHGQTPYDLASSNNVRQFLLPIQLQKETQIALDNGGQGLPPGIDLGGLRIKNSNMAPPPMSFGSEPRAQTTSMYPPTPQPADPSRIASAPATMPPNMNTSNMNTTAASNTAGGYSLKGSSSAAILNSKYSADGFHSSSSDVNLQRKYGHDTASRQYVTPPPPSSGNAASLSSLSDGAPVSGNLGGDPMNNPFSRGSALPKQRYVSYGPTATQSAPSTYNQYVPTPGAAAPAYGTFTPNNAAAQAPASAAPPTPTQPAAQNAVNTPSTPFMPPPPYQTHNYDSPSKQPGFVSPAAATYGGSPMTPMVPSTAPASGGSAHDLFAAPANPQATTAPAPISTGSAHELFATPQPAEPTSREPDVPAETVPPTSFEGPDGGEETSPKEAAQTEQTKEEVVSENQPQGQAKSKEADEATEEEISPSTDAKPDETPAEPQPTPGDETSDWVETTDPSSGQIYYYNTVTQETSWEDPRSKASESSSPESDWVETEDPSSGKVYYYNKVSHETSWEKPPGFAANKASADDETSVDEWVETVDPTSGQTYYYNQRTQETSWEKPASMTQDDDKQDTGAKGSNDWVETVDPNSGQVYFYNQVTHETAWEKPAAMTESQSSKVPTTDRLPTEETIAAEDSKTDSTVASEWMETVDPSSGKTYYYNSETGETSWEKPEAAKEEPTEEKIAPITKDETSDTTSSQQLEKSLSAHDLFGASAPATDRLTSAVPTEDKKTISEPTATTNEIPTTAEPLSVSDATPEDAASQTFQAPSTPAEHAGPVDTTQTLNESAPAAAQTFEPPPVSSEGSADAVQVFGSPSGTQFKSPSMSSTAAESFQPPPLSSEVTSDIASEPATTSAADVFGASNADPAVPKEDEAPEAVSEEKKMVEQDLSGEGEMLDVPLSPDPCPPPVKPIDQSADLFAAIGMPPPPFQSKR